jgi:hypothetical protein
LFTRRWAAYSSAWSGGRRFRYARSGSQSRIRSEAPRTYSIGSGGYSREFSYSAARYAIDDVGTDASLSCSRVRGAVRGVSRGRRF